MIGVRRSFCAAALIAASYVLVGPASAHSLALTYTLSQRVGAPPRATISSDGCRGLAGLALRCRSEMLRPVSGPGANGSEVAAKPSDPSIGESAAPAAPVRRIDPPARAAEAADGYKKLPELGSSLSDAPLRYPEVGDAPATASKSLDVVLRLGSQYRFRNGDERWERYRFKDVANEHQTNAPNFRKFGVELLVPFD